MRNDASDYAAGWTLTIPMRYLIAGAAVIPVLQIRRATRRRNLEHIGRCPVCGYDLRATPNRCPECGTPAKEPA